MNPSAQPANTGFTPKYRNFLPLDRVWIQNPFDHDVVFQVADEYNRPFKYRLPAHKVSELPGGAIATLGVKEVVDEMIQSSEKDNAQVWDPNIRAKYEAQVIMRVKQTSVVTDSATPGEINLAVSSSEQPENDTEITQKTEEVPFPGLNQPTAGMEPQLAPLPDAVGQGIGDIVAASLPSANVEISASNTHANIEG